MGSRVYHSILSALGGSNDVQFSRGADGQMVATSVTKKPGAQWKQIISAALTGLAAGAGQVGPGAMGRALGGGIQAGQQMVKQQQQKKKDTANQDYDVQQKALVRKAQLQQMAVTTAGAVLSNTRLGQEISQTDADNYNKFHQMLRDTGATDVGHFSTVAAFTAESKINPTIVEDLSHGRPSVTPYRGADGKTDGFEVSIVPDAWGTGPLPKDMPVPDIGMNKDGSPKLTWDRTVPAGSPGDDYRAYVLATTMKYQTMLADKNEGDYKKQQIKTSATEAGKNAAEAKALNTAGDDATIQSNAAQLVHGSMDPSNLAKSGKAGLVYNKTVAAANEISMRETGRPFPIATAIADYKFASNPQTKNTLNFLNSLTGRDNNGGNLGTVVQLSDALRQGKFPALNDVEQWSKLASGNAQVAAYRAALVETSDQVAKILQGGGTGNGTSDAKLEQAQTLFNKGFNGKQMHATANTMRDLLGNRKKEMIGDNRYLQQWYGTPTPAANGAPAGPQTHVFTVSTWKAANPSGDANAAQAQAKQQGYTVVP